MFSVFVHVTKVGPVSVTAFMNFVNCLKVKCAVCWCQRHQTEWQSVFFFLSSLTGFDITTLALLNH